MTGAVATLLSFAMLSAMLGVVAGGRLGAQAAPRIDALVAAVRPALPYPGASSDGDFPADNSAEPKWFVLWPRTPDETRIIVKANPLHPETQKLAAIAMGRIQEAVIAAERRAQASYDRALDELRRTGTATDIDGISLDDEGSAGERIDAELELVIELSEPHTFSVTSGVAPVVAAGRGGPTWTFTIPAHTYRATRGDDLREHFRAAETVLYFGIAARPDVTSRGDDPAYTVSVLSASQGVAVVLRGNEQLLKEVAATANWARLAQP